MVSALALILAAAPPPVTIDSLLDQMADLRHLAQRPSPWFRLRQASSTDRSPEPFANADYGQFLRTETHGGRVERVMADLKGPGCVVRFWSANPSGTVRFYFDGESKPRLEANMETLLSGGHPWFPGPFAYVASRGANLYFPIPYAKGLKVTWDGGGKESGSGLYYVIGHRDYAPGTIVETFTPALVEASRGRMRRVARDLTAKLPAPKTDKRWQGAIRSGGAATLDLTARNGGAIDGFVVKIDATDDPQRAWADPARLHNVLRKLRLRMSFDGETTVDVPLGDFFGSAPGLCPYRTLPLEVRPDGTMIARWTMPFRRAARVWISNGNPMPIALTLGTSTARRRFDTGTYLFHARWHSQTKPTEPRYDFTFLGAKGEGMVVGTMLQVTNPVPEWWGEGDERVSVDGDSAPSLIGTGTEDYFGYAWSDPTPFERPYHAQPPTEHLGNFGQVDNLRFLILDPIPYRRSVRFDMEAWHWKATVATYATTAFWYARPGGTLPEPPDPRTLLVRETPLPKPVAGAIEGEDSPWRVSGGQTEIQGGFFQLSGLRQFWWRDAQPEAVATTVVRVPQAGRYEVFANFGHARDYGRFRVSVAGNAPKEMDFYQDGLEWRRESLGTFDLPAGETTIRFEVIEPNPKIQPKRNMLGVDYFLLEKR